MLRVRRATCVVPLIPHSVRISIFLGGFLRPTADLVLLFRPARAGRVAPWRHRTTRRPRSASERRPSFADPEKSGGREAACIAPASLLLLLRPRFEAPSTTKPTPTTAPTCASRRSSHRRRLPIIAVCGLGGLSLWSLYYSLHKSQLLYSTLVLPIVYRKRLCQLHSCQLSVTGSAVSSRTPARSQLIAEAPRRAIKYMHNMYHDMLYT